MQHETQQDSWKRLAGEEAVKLVQDGMIVGIGTGSTAAYFIKTLARRIQAGLTIGGAVPTSLATEQLARSLDIPLTTLDIHPELDLAIDGADEVDSQFNLIKGGGGALLREKIVASAARRFVVIGDISKQVPKLGQKFPLPVEVVPFGVTPVKNRLEKLHATVQLRRHADQVFITDNGNMILDCTFANGIAYPADLDQHMRNIAGVVTTGLFTGLTHQLIIGGPEGVRILP